MTEKTVAQKAGVKPGTKIAVVNPVPGVVDSLGLPEAEFVDVPEARIVLLFVNSHAELNSALPAAVAVLSPGAAVWVFFRKGSKAAGLDMGRNDVWEMAEGLGLRPLGLVSVDDVWSAFRLRPAGQ